MPSAFVPGSSAVVCLILLASSVACGAGTRAEAESGGSSAGGQANDGNKSGSGGEPLDHQAGNGGASNGGATNGGATNGGATNGGATNGGATNGGATNGGATNGGAGNGGGANRGCPSTAPSADAPCGPDHLGLTCFYEDCAADRGRTVATCSTSIPDPGNPVQTWSAQSSSCQSEVDCLGTRCALGEVCVIVQGGARFGTCGKHTCGGGPIECDCVSGCFPGCVPAPMGGDPAFMCNTCSDPRGCP